LGQSGEATTDAGAPYKFSFHVVNGAIFVTSDFGSWTTTRAIRTNGKDLCTCTLQYRKKPGQASFIYPASGGVSIYSDMHAENMTCSIEQTPN
jgi:hypothetical protein